MSEATVGLREIRDARERLGDLVRNTPLFTSETFSGFLGTRVFLKAESLQRTGSFKIRGALNKVRRLHEHRQIGSGVICASAGNHAGGVALAAKICGVPASIVMPIGTPLVKLERTRRYGARIVLRGESYDDAYQEAVRFATAEELTFVHAFDDPDVIAGQGTIGLEIVDALPDVGTIVVPAGGGGLVAGIACAVKTMKPSVRIIAVQVEAARALAESVRRGQLTDVAAAQTLADGIRVRRPGAITLPLIQQYVDDVVTVDEEETADAVVRLLDISKLVVEGAGAVPLAACLAGKVSLGSQPVVLLLSGGNIDSNQMARIIERGLTKAGRYLVIRMPLRDRPGELQGVLALLAAKRVNVVEIFHYRAGWQVPVGWAEVEMVLETRDADHGAEILHHLHAAGHQPVKSGGMG